MASEEEVKFNITAETKELTEKLLHAKESIEKLGDAKNLTGLVEGLTKVGVGLGVVGVAGFALKTVFETVFDAEAIRKVNTQFEVLADNAGVAGEALKEGLVGASKGLIDDTDLLKLANKGLVELGQNAKKLPEVMELARKVTSVMGGSLAQNFEEITQAIANGNARALKHLGIVIDQDKAYKDFAKSLGQSVDVLSQAGKQAAIMEAALKKGETAFDGIAQTSGSATSTLQQLIVTFEQIKEVIILALDKTMGPSVRAMITGLRELAGEAKRSLTASLGEGAEKAQAQVEILEGKITSLKAALIDIDQRKVARGGVISSDDQQLLDAYTQKLRAYEAQLNSVRSQLRQAEEETKKGSRGPAEAPAGGGFINEQAALMQKAEFEEKMLAIRKRTLEFQKKEEVDFNNVEALLAEERLQIYQKLALDIQKAENDTHVSELQRTQNLTDIKKAAALHIAEFEKNIEKEKIELLEKSKKQQESIIDGVVSSFKLASLKNQAQLKDLGAMGKQTYDNFSHHATDALMEIGEGTKSAGDIAKGFLFGFLADEAQARGSMVLASSIWPPNPVGLAAGAGLLVLAGFLRSQAKGASSSAAPTPSVSAGGSASDTGVRGASDFGTRTDERPTLGEIRQQKSVTIQVQGHYFETEQTKTALVDMLRQSGDATDYKVQQIGGL